MIDLIKRVNMTARKLTVSLCAATVCAAFAEMTVNESVTLDGDADWRNPLAWRLQGSNDGKNWTDLDVVGCANPHTCDKTLAYSRRLDVPREPPENAVIYPVRTSDGRRLVSYDVNGTAIHELAPDAR